MRERINSPPHGTLPKRERIRKSVGLIRDLVDFVDLVLDGVLEAVDAEECDEISHSDEDEAQTEQSGGNRLIDSVLQNYGIKYIS